MCTTCKNQTPDTEPTAWQCQDVSIWIYKQLPANMRLATHNDLFDRSLKPRYGTYFLVQSFYTPFYHAYKLNANFTTNELKLFIEKQKAYVRAT